MRSVLIIVSLIIVSYSYAHGQEFSYKSIYCDSSFIISNIDINNDGIKDKVAYNKRGNDLILYILHNGVYEIVYHGENYSMDGIYSLVQMKSYTENDNVLYIKNIFNGAGGQTIEYFLSYKNNNWQLSHSIMTSSTYDETKICVISYLQENKTEECIVCNKNKGSIQNEINLELITNINKYSNIITNEFIFSIINISPLSLKNVTSYNNLAFKLEQIKKFSESIYILEKVINKFPNRIVAHINLGDAYWGLIEKENAKQAYLKYIELMKECGKESKIPQRVFDRISN